VSAAAFFEALRAVFADEEARLNALDQAVGDGDHGSTMRRGLEATATVSEARGKAFARAAGGASGTLFGVLLDQLEAVLADPAANGGNLALALQRAADRVALMGQAKPGDKSMLDPIASAAGALAEAQDLSLAHAAALAVSIAEQGAEATTAMVGRRGRVRYVAGGGVGHPDPGARSVVLVLNAFAQAVEQDS
jgi:phosphoenolpyruvate---glycerone phosphotransferase subunit DhaL